MDTITISTTTVANNLSLDVGPNIAELLNKLASGLGVASGKLMEIYTRQAYLIAWRQSISFGVVLLLGLLLVYGFWKFARKANRCKDNTMKDNYEVWCILLFFGMILYLVLLSLFLGHLDYTIAGFCNPQYVAVHEIMSDLKTLIGK